MTTGDVLDAMSALERIRSLCTPRETALITADYTVVNAVLIRLYDALLEGQTGGRSSIARRAGV